MREQKVEKTKEYRNGPIIEDKFKMSKFTTSQAPKIDTNLKPFSTSNQNLQNSQQNQPATEQA